MKFKFYCITTALLISFNIVSAQMVLNKKLSLSRGITENRKAFSLIDTDNAVSIFLLDKKTIYGLDLDSSTSISKEIKVPTPSNEFGELLGGSISGNQKNLFFINAAKKRLHCTWINFNENKFGSNKINLQLDKEEFIGNISYKNKFYILTTRKNTSTLNLYIFENHFSFQKKTFDFPNEKFTTESMNTLYHAFFVSSPVIIDNSIPNPLDQTRHANKIYYYDDKIVITIDNQLTRTKVITIDLIEMIAKIDSYKYAKLDCGELYNARSNSYIHQGILYQLKVCTQSMGLSIVDLANNTVLKNYITNRNEDINYRNSDIIHMTGTGSPGENDYHVSRTNQFLRKLANSNAAISAYRVKDKIELMLGSYVYVDGLISFTPPFSPFTVFYSYTLTKSIYFKSVLHAKDYAHAREIHPEQFAFDKIQDFILKGNLKDKMTAETIYKISDDYYLGYYVKPDHTYVIQRFTE